MTYATQDTGLELYRRRIAKERTLDAELEISLSRAWAAGDERAGCRLIEGNLSLVIAIAREYRRWGVPLEDLVQQGAIGLHKAACRYDVSRGSRLRAYAAYWIRAEIRDYVVRSYRMVRLGTTRTERRAIRAYRSRSVANVTELAELSGMPLSRCELLWPVLQGGDRSLDATFDGQPALIDSIRGGERSPEQQVADAEQEGALCAAVRDALATLPERERHVLRRRYMNAEQSTLEELGRELGVSRERVRQLEERAKTRLRGMLQATAPVAGLDTVSASNA